MAPKPGHDTLRVEVAYQSQYITEGKTVYHYMITLPYFRTLPCQPNEIHVFLQEGFYKMYNF